MLRFLAERILLALAAFFGVLLLVFIISRTTSDPAALLIPVEATPELAAQIRASLGLDAPIAIQFIRYLGQILTLDFGISHRTSIPVAQLLAERGLPSLLLTLTSFAIGALVGAPLGIIAAVWRGRWPDGLARAFAVLGQSIPPFVVAIMLVQYVAANIMWLPAGGADRWTSIILPALNLGIFLSAAIVRLLRTSLIDALQSDYVRIARLKGLSEWKVICKHALKNALLPVLAVTGLYVSLSVTVAVVTEVIFAWPGLGQLAFDAIIYRDLPVLQAVVIIASSVTIVVSFAVDWISAVIDPRIRSSAAPT